MQSHARQFLSHIIHYLQRILRTSFYNFISIANSVLLFSSFLSHYFVFSFLATFVLKGVSEFIFLFLINHHQKPEANFGQILSSYFDTFCLYISFLYFTYVLFHCIQLKSWYLHVNAFSICQLLAEQMCTTPEFGKQSSASLQDCATSLSVFFVCRFLFISFSHIGANRHFSDKKPDSYTF